jgi:hypothetical protein
MKTSTPTAKVGGRRKTITAQYRMRNAIVDRTVDLVDV